MIGPARNRRRQQETDVPRLRVWILALLLGAVAGWWGRGAALEAMSEAPLRVAHVAVSGNERVEAPELVALAGLTLGQRLLEIEPERVRAAVIAHPWVRDARVATMLPNRVLLAVDERLPRAVAVLAESAVFVDAAGIPFAPADAATALPRIIGLDAVAHDDADPMLVQALRLLDAAAAEGLPIPHEIILDGPRAGVLPAIVWERQGRTPLTAMLGSEAPGPALRNLAQAWMADLNELRDAREIDLRFSGQLILRGNAVPEESDEEEDASATSAVATSHGQGGESWQEKMN